MTKSKVGLGKRNGCGYLSIGYNILLSLALDPGGKAHIIYNDDTNGDLKYATNTSGVWVTEKLDSYGDVGSYSSLALDSGGKAHIGYNNYLFKGLTYATNESGLWEKELIHGGGESRSVTLVLDSEGKAHIGFEEYTPFDSVINYSTNQSGTWITEGVASRICDTFCEHVNSPSLALDTEGSAHLSYGDVNLPPLGWAGLTYATNESGDWLKEGVDYSFGNARFTSLALDAEGKAHISYYDYNNDDLKYATNESGSWVKETVDTTGDVGQYTSLALDAAGKPHISYYDTTNGDLKYTTNTSGVWETETADINGDVGQYTSLILDSGGKAYISYYDASNGDLKYATNKSGDWVVETVDSEGDVGQYTSLALDSCGRSHISYYDATNGDLKYARQFCGMDFDCDYILDMEDNCPKDYNPNQEDTYPPQGNSIGDACECEGNFNCSADQDVDGSDAALFKVDFGRSGILDPCTGGSLCNGDFNCDGDADGTDAALFKADFGRSSMQNPCPACVAGVEWCSYPLP